MSRPSLFYDDRYQLYYIFRLGESFELDTELIGKIKNGTASLESTPRGYAVHDGERILCDSCSSVVFYEWYQRQPYLGAFVREKGIHENRVVQTLPQALPPRPIQPRLQAQPQPQPQPQPQHKAKPLRQVPKPHLAQLVLRDAIAQKKICTITLEPITMESTCIAPCYHCFDKDAIDAWLSTNTTCPECRESCA